jgi:hypothetical protein
LSFFFKIIIYLINLNGYIACIEFFWVLQFIFKLDEIFMKLLNLAAKKVVVAAAKKMFTPMFPMSFDAELHAAIEKRVGHCKHAKYFK